MKTYWGIGVIAPPFLTLALGHFTPGEISGTFWLGGSVGLRSFLDAEEKRTIFPCLHIESGSSSLSLYQLSHPES